MGSKVGTSGGGLETQGRPSPTVPRELPSSIQGRPSGLARITPGEKKLKVGCQWGGGGARDTRSTVPYCPQRASFLHPR